MLAWIWRKGETYSLVMGMQTGQPLWKSVWNFLESLEIDLLYDQAIPLLGIFPKFSILYSCMAARFKFSGMCVWIRVPIAFSKLGRLHRRAVQGKGREIEYNWMASKWWKKIQDGGGRWGRGETLGKEEQSVHIGSCSETPGSFHSLCPIRNPWLISASQGSAALTFSDSAGETMMLWSKRVGFLFLSAQVCFRVEVTGLDRRRSKAKSLPLGFIHTKDACNRGNGMMLPFHSVPEHTPGSCCDV